MGVIENIETIYRKAINKGTALSERIMSIGKPDTAFPEVFSLAAYKKYNADIANFSDEDARNHFVVYGQHEGRRCSEIHDRASFLALMPGGKGLEIGPFDMPAISGENVKYFDVLDQAALKIRAVEHHRNPETCPYIDFVSPTGDLSIIKEQFDFVISSHCIEHQPDLVEHLNRVSDILVSGGNYFLIIPDKRYCFDHFIPESNISDIIQADLEKRRIHTLKSLVEHYALTTHNDPNRHWGGDHGDFVQSEVNSRVALAIVDYEKSNGKYIDVHSWRFTPTSFERIINSLADLKKIGFRIERSYSSIRGSLEFYAILTKV